MKLTIDRMKHSLAVASKMKSIVLDESSKFNCSPEDAFLLGILHDTGYEFALEQKVHAKIGGLILKDQGYKYWKEVIYHGIPQTEYLTPMLTLLNFADMTTSPTGEYITIEQRVADIAERYGEDSIQVLEAKELSVILFKTGLFK